MLFLLIVSLVVLLGGGLDITWKYGSKLNNKAVKVPKAYSFLRGLSAVNLYRIKQMVLKDMKPDIFADGETDYVSFLEALENEISLAMKKENRI